MESDYGSDTDCGTGKLRGSKPAAQDGLLGAIGCRHRHRSTGNCRVPKRQAPGGARGSGAEQRRPRPPSLAAAVTILARFAFLAVHRPAMLEIAEFAVRLDIIAQRRAAGLDRLGQHLADGGRQSFGPDPDDAAGEAARRYPGPVQRLADIDIA